MIALKVLLLKLLQPVKKKKQERKLLRQQILRSSGKKIHSLKQNKLT